MASIAQGVFERAAKNINRVLGDSFTYSRKADGVTTPDVMITINRNKKVNDAFGNLVAYRNEASIVKTDLTTSPAPYDTFSNADGQVWRVGDITQENTAKWYIDVVEL